MPVKFLALAPGVVLMASGSMETALLYRDAGIEVIELDVGEPLKVWGSIHGGPPARRGRLTARQVAGQSDTARPSGSATPAPSSRISSRTRQRRASTASKSVLDM